MLVDLGIAQLRIDRLAAKVPLEAPWEAPNARRLDSETVATWTRRNVRTKLGREFLRVVVEAVFSAEPEDISMLHFLFYMHSGGTLDNLTADHRRRPGLPLPRRLPGGLDPDGGRPRGRGAARAPRSSRSPRPATASTVGGHWGQVDAERVVVAVAPAVIPRISFAPGAERPRAPSSTRRCRPAT